MSPSDGVSSKLLDAFRAVCVEQFAVDLREGDAHLAERDAPALRRLAHNLKSVLATLCEPHAAAAAQRLEDAVLSLEWAACRNAWCELRKNLIDLISIG